jgi:hypothetical protein
MQLILANITDLKIRAQKFEILANIAPLKLLPTASR